MDPEECRLRDEMIAELDAIKARSGEGEEFFQAMARHVAKLDAHADKRNPWRKRLREGFSMTIN